MTMKRYIAMQKRWFQSTSPLDPIEFEPRNKLYDYAGQARAYSMSPRLVGDARIDNGYVLAVDLTALPRVTFDAKGRAVGIGKDGEMTLTEELEEAERMLETWAKRCMEIRARLALGES